MGGVLSYSGLSTKIRAMQSRLTTMEQFEEILQLSNVTQVAAYLKRMPEYSSKWDALDENTLHRGQIEKLLKKSIFQNFSRIYHFANPEQRKFLDLYSRRYEIRVLKEVMTKSALKLESDGLTPIHGAYIPGHRSPCTSRMRVPVWPTDWAHGGPI